MAKLPHLVTCILADQVRPELGNKCTILGFFGIAPHAELSFQVFPSVINLAAMLLCEVVTEPGDFRLEVEINSDRGSVLPRTPVSPIEVRADQTRAMCILNFQGLPIEGAGRYTVNVYSMDELHSENSFACKLAPSPYLVANGVPTMAYSSQFQKPQ